MTLEIFSGRRPTGPRPRLSLWNSSPSGSDGLWTQDFWNMSSQKTIQSIGALVLEMLKKIGPFHVENPSRNERCKGAPILETSNQ